MEMDTVFSPGVVPIYQRELMPVKGMEDMCNPEGLRHIERNRCS